jgi:hypothetical protein
LAILFIDGVCTYRSKQEFLPYFLILVLPLAAGILRGIKIDSKLTKDERIKIRNEIDKLPDSEM